MAMTTTAPVRPRERLTLTSESIPVVSDAVQEAVGRRKWYILAVLSLCSFMLLLDSTIVNVAIPAIMKDFGTDIASIEWILNGYLLTLAVLIITLGRLADLYGRRLFFAGGAIVFTAASLVAGLAPNLGVLVAARVLQGIGAAAMLPSSLSIITATFPKAQRGAALGILSATSGIAVALGPILGGVITEGSSWRWIFLINLPLGIIATVGAFGFVYESIDREAKRAIDYLGVITISLTMFALAYALVEGQRYGWTSTTILGLLATSAISLVIFALVERGRVNALVDLKLFKNRTFVAANSTGLVMMFGMIGLLFPLTLFLQVILGVSAIETGLSMTPLAFAMMVSAPFAGRLSDRIGSRWPIVAGLLFCAGGLYWLGQLTLQTNWTDLIIPMAVAGLGIGVVMSPTTAVVMANAPLEKAGNASGTLNTMRQIGSALGVSVLGAILQNQLVTNVTNALSRYPLPQEVKNRVIAELNSGVQIQSVSSLASGNSPLAAQLRQLFNEQFVTSLNQTMVIGAAVVLVGAFVALLIRNHIVDSEQKTS